MIARKFRTPRQQIEFILKKGNQFTSNLFLTRTHQNQEKFNRYSVIISKKIWKLATKRNRLRRQIFESIRTSAINPDTSPHFDIVLIPKKIIIKKTGKEIDTDIKDILSKLDGKI